MHAAPDRPQRSGALHVYVQISPNLPVLVLAPLPPLVDDGGMTMSDVSVDSVSHAEPGRWLTIQEAARHLSVSERTVYRRADRGLLQRRTHPDGRVEVWVTDAPLTEVSDVSPDTVSQERAVILVDRVSAAVSRQLESLTVEIAASRERVEVLARENGALTERLAGLQRELTAVRQMSDDDRQRLTAERDAAREALAAAHSPESPPDAPTATPDAGTATAPRVVFSWPLWRWYAALFVVAALLALLLTFRAL